MDDACQWSAMRPWHKSSSRHAMAMSIIKLLPHAAPDQRIGGVLSSDIGIPRDSRVFKVRE